MESFVRPKITCLKILMGIGFEMVWPNMLPLSHGARKRFLFGNHDPYETYLLVIHISFKEKQNWNCIYYAECTSNEKNPKTTSRTWTQAFSLFVILLSHQRNICHSLPHHVFFLHIPHFLQLLHSHAIIETKQQY